MLIHEEQKQCSGTAYSSTPSARKADTVLVGAQKKLSVGSGNSGNRKQVKCFECKFFGHIRRDCPKRQIRSSVDAHRVKTAKEQEQVYSECDQAFGVSVGSVQRGQWLVDSGASSHMTPDRVVDRLLSV